MFLDEELEQIWNTDAPYMERSKGLLLACVNRLGDDKSYTNLRRIDNSFQLFAKRHDDVLDTLFRDFVIRIIGEDFRDILGW